MINIKTMQQSQTRESIGEHTLLGSAQSVPPCMTEYDINSAVRGQHRGHLKWVGQQLTHMTSPVGASSAAAAGSSTSVPGPTPAEQTAIPELVHQQVTGMLQSYQ